MQFLKKIHLKKSVLVPVYFITLCPSDWQCNPRRESRIPARLTHTSVGAKQERFTSQSRWVGQSRWAPSTVTGLVQLSKEGRVVPQLLKGYLAPPWRRANPTVCSRHTQAAKTPQPNPICDHNAAGAGCALPGPAARVNVQPPSKCCCCSAEGPFLHTQIAYSYFLLPFFHE